MTTTLVTQRRARPRHAAALAAAAVRAFQGRGIWSPARLRLRLFQGWHQPDLMLVLSDWTSREAAARFLAASPVRSGLDRFSLGAAEHSCYHELTSYEPLTAPVVVAACTRLQCARAAMPGLLTYLLDVTGPTLRAQPGLVLHTLYQDDDQPTRFLSLRG